VLPISYRGAQCQFDQVEAQIAIAARVLRTMAERIEASRPS
jgi:hypothetical protein